MKEISESLSENFQFLMVKFSIYLNRHVFVMIKILRKITEPGYSIFYNKACAPSEKSGQLLIFVDVQTDPSLQRT